MCVVRWGVAWGGVDKEMSLTELQREERSQRRKKMGEGSGQGGPRGSRLKGCSAGERASC